MALIVLDASVLVKALVTHEADEADTGRALALWDRIRAGDDEPVQPAHWLAEVGAVLARLSPATVERDVRDLCVMGLPVRDTAAVYSLASHLAGELDHHLFDTLYHAVALETEGATLITADERYYRKAKHLGRILRLADYEA